jgi:hypothetical protein
MMHSHEEDVLHLGQPHKGGTDQRSVRQDKRLLDVCLRSLVHPCFLRALGQRLQVYSRYRKAYGLPNALERLAGNIGKRCAQDFVTPDNFL